MSARNLFADAKAARDAAHQKKVASLTQPDAVYLASLRAAVEEGAAAAEGAAARRTSGAPARAARRRRCRRSRSAEARVRYR